MLSDDVPEPPTWNNANVGVVGSELLRRLNLQMDGALDKSTYKRAVSAPVVRRLSALPDRALPALDEVQRKWAAETSARFAEEIRERGYRVVGDLDDLLPQAPSAESAAEAAERDPEALEDSAAAADRPEGAHQAVPADLLASAEGAVA